MGEQVIVQSPLTVPEDYGWSPRPVFDVFKAKSHHLCGDPEGWGPTSELRFDFTPCFLDLWLLFVAAWGLLFGAGAVWYLLRKRSAQDVQKNWHFYAKLYASQLISRHLC
jgi:hypothetical protein